MLKFLLTGFPSPWRWWRRHKAKKKFIHFSSRLRDFQRESGIDPLSKIARGEL